MTSWQTVWREGFAPHLSTSGLRALEQALLTDDPRLLQGATTTPPLLACVQDWPAEGACVIGFVGAVEHGGLASDCRQEGTATVADVEEFFARTCFACDQTLGEPAGCRWFLNWFDETPRDEARMQLLAEVQRTLAQREQREAGAA